MLLAQIRPSALVLSVVMSIGVVAGLIALQPALTHLYYVQMGALIAGAGLIVTLYNFFLTRRAGRGVETTSPSVAPTVDCTAVAASPAYAATAESEQLVTAVARPAIAVVRDEVQHAEELLPDGLDDLLDIAYEAAANDPIRAIAAYRRALARYPADTYMPYLIIELSTLYKQLGDYDAALALYDQALALPLVAKNAVMVQEFQRSRKTLAVVSDMLTALGTPSLPFGEIPKEILAEANRRAEELTT